MAVLLIYSPYYYQLICNFMPMKNYIVVTHILVFMLCVGLSRQASAQCFPITLIDSVTGCNGNTFSLPASIPPTYTVSNVSWLPTAGLSAANVLNPTVTVGGTTTTYTVSITGSTALLVPNGDFNSTTANFTGAYILGTGGPWGPVSNTGTYFITNDPFLAHSNFPTFGDHTTGTGNMLVVNGSSVANADIWCQTISVTPNTTYTVNVWAANCVGSNMPDLQFFIDGIPTGAIVTLGAATGIWTPVTAVFTTGPTATSVNACLQDLTLAASGNDFALDDFSITNNCTSVDSVKVKSNGLDIDFNFNYNLGCTEDTVSFNAITLASATPVLSYSWNFGDFGIASGSSVSHVYSNQAIYNVTLIANNGNCADTVVKQVNVIHPFIPGFSIPKDSICLGQSTTTNNFSIGMGLQSSWSMGDGTPPIQANQVTYTYATGGTYTITLVLTNAMGCVDSIKKTIYVEQTYPVGFSISKDTVCVGEAIFINDTISPFINSFIYNFGNGFTSTYHNPTHTYTEAGPQMIILTLGYKVCTAQNKTINIAVLNTPIVNAGPDTSYCPGLTAPITLTANAIYANSILWNTGSSNTSIPVSEGGGAFWVTASNGYCSAADTVLVNRDCYLNIPNSFTPDADGLNDYFLPRELLSSGLISFNMSIFNRWGEQVYTTSSLTGRGWDGNFGSKPQPMGAYVYTIRYTLKNGEFKSYTGNVTLLR